jgi:hypothetical protein
MSCQSCTAVTLSTCAAIIVTINIHNTTPHLLHLNSACHNMSVTAYISKPAAALLRTASMQLGTGSTCFLSSATASVRHWQGELYKPITMFISYKLGTLNKG